MDTETKLVPCFKVGKRNLEVTQSFVSELNKRITSRFQLSSDSFNQYLGTIKREFGEEIDYGQVHKEYIETGKMERRYSPVALKKIHINPLIGNPKIKNISTSYIERQNLTMRM